MKKKYYSIFLLLSLNIYCQNFGALDNSFGNNGKVVIDVGNTIPEIQNKSVQSDSKIIVCGRFENGLTSTGFIPLS